MGVALTVTLFDFSSNDFLASLSALASQQKRL